MSDANPFEIDLPKNGEKLDLSPIMMPLLHAIREEIKNHEYRCHWGNGPERAKELLPEQMYAYMVRAIDGVEYHRIVSQIDRESIVAYLKEQGFKSTCVNGSVYELYDDKVLTYHPNMELSFIHKNEAVTKISISRSKSKLQVAREIEAMTNVLDRIVAKL